jgi:hypothetical protein
MAARPAGCRQSAVRHRLLASSCQPSPTAPASTSSTSVASVTSPVSPSSGANSVTIAAKSWPPPSRARPHTTAPRLAGQGPAGARGHQPPSRAADRAKVAGQIAQHPQLEHVVLAARRVRQRVPAEAADSLDHGWTVRCLPGQRDAPRPSPARVSSQHSGASASSAPGGTGIGSSGLPANRGSTGSTSARRASPRLRAHALSRSAATTTSSQLRPSSSGPAAARRRRPQAPAPPPPRRRHRPHARPSPAPGRTTAAARAGPAAPPRSAPAPGGTPGSPPGRRPGRPAAPRRSGVPRQIAA